MERITLRGAVAYRIDSLAEFAAEIAAWEFVKEGPKVTCAMPSCPGSAEYQVFVQLSASLESSVASLKKVIHTQCPNHQPKVVAIR